jgi:hypothetical protein
MRPGDDHDHIEQAADIPTVQTTLFPLAQSRPLPIRELRASDQPRSRLLQQGAAVLSDAELLAVLTGVSE